MEETLELLLGRFAIWIELSTGYRVRRTAMFIPNDWNNLGSTAKLNALTLLALHFENVQPKGHNVTQLHSGRRTPAI